MKIVINTCYGGFGISDKAIERYAELKGIELERRKSKWTTDGFDYYHKGGDIFSTYDIPRDDSILIQVVIELNESANDWASDLKIVDIPDKTDWQIEEYDGREWVAEKHETWS